MEQKNTPDREKIVAAAVARAKEVTEQKKIRREKAERQKEEAERAEQEKIEKMKMVAAEKSEALEKKDAIKSAEAKSYAAAAAEKRAVEAEQMRLVSSQTEAREKEATCPISNTHKLKGGTQIMSSDRNLSYNLGNTPLTFSNPPKKENHLRENDDLQTAKGTSEKRINLGVIDSHAKEEEPLSTAVDNQPKKLDYSEELDHTNKSGVKPKEIINRPLVYPAHNQAEQNSGQPNKSGSIIDIQPNCKTTDRQKKEIVTVTGKTVSQSRGSGGQKEAVFMTGHENFIVNEPDESFINKSDKLGIDYEEAEHKKKIKNKEFEKNKQEYTQGCWSTHTSGNKGAKEPIHEGEHSCRNQQHTTSPTRGYKGFQHSHQQPYPKEQQNHIHNNEGRKERDHRYNPYTNHPRAGAQQISQFSGSPRGLVCGSCDKMFNIHDRLPRNLFCGHSICSCCTSIQVKNLGYVSCPTCTTRTWHVKSLEHLTVNQPLVELLSGVIQDDAKKESQERRGLHVYEGSNRGQYHSQPRDNEARSGVRQAGNKFNPPRSPHGSKCMEIGVRPSVYCCSCNVWVCSRCAETEHSSRRCSVIALKDQLAAMTQKNLQEGNRAQELLRKSLQDLENCLNEDKIFLMLIKTALECIEKKQECMKKELREGRKLRESLTDAIKVVTGAVNFPEALAAFQEVEDKASAVQQWVSSSELRTTSDDQEKTTCLKHLLRRILQSLLIENGASNTYAVDKLFGAELYSELRAEGGRYHLHALRRSHPSSQGSRALPVECFKSCQDAESTLVFLDLSWGGMDRGRLYIRLTGDTLRGRQFISLCIGESGISFRGTCFHRVWWKGLPGEHVWTGDFEKCDGSGGRSFFSPCNHEKVPAGRKVPISEGLVAGRYEKKKISSVFRIYTRMEKAGVDEAGFGQVEFGLDVVREAVKLRNITDVMISDCGLVLEM